jgi:hypothetical protein
MEPSSFPTMVMADYNLYRLDDYIFFAIAGIAVLFCLVHAARRAFRQPVPTETEERKKEGEWEKK